jgi:cation diffusion facilitator family transporter
MAEGSERLIVVIGAMTANIAIAVAKVIAAVVSGSSAMLAEAIHSFADTGNEVLLLVGLRRSHRPPDARHPYGHGKELFFWGLIVAMVLFGLGGGLSIYEGITHLLHPHDRGSMTASYITLVVAVVFESSSLFLGLRSLRRRWPDKSLWDALRESKDPSVYTVVAEDVAAIAGLFVAFTGILISDLTGHWEIDAIASILVGLILAVVALALADESRTLLTGESGDAELVADLERIVKADADVRRAGRPLTMRLGPDEVLLNLDVDFRPELSGDALRGVIERIDKQIRAAHPEVTRIFLEAATVGRTHAQGS